MTHGTILFCRRQSWLSKAIRKVSRSEWSHTSLVLELWGVTYIIEMQRKGIMLYTYAEWKRLYNYDYIAFEWEWKDDPFMKRKLAHQALKIVGERKKYDFFMLFVRFPIKIFTGKYYFRGVENEKKRMVCSQLTAYLHGVDHWWKQSPDSLHKSILKNVNFKKK